VQEDLEDMDLDEVQQLLEAVAKSSEAEAKTALADLEKEKAIQVWFGDERHLIWHSSKKNPVCRITFL
jgi:hypothetical protein